MNAEINYKAKLDMDITRRNPDGSIKCVEHVEGDWGELDEGTKGKLLELPSFRHWLRKQKEK